MNRVCGWVAALCAGVAVLALARLGTGAPVKGPYGVREAVRVGGAGEVGGKQTPGTVSLSETFRGGQRACVLLDGDHKPPAPLSIFVYDQANQLVAKDESDIDYAAAIWYPPRDGAYRIEIHNFGKDYNDVRVVMK